MQVKPVIAASGSSPIIPPSWTVPNWFIDPANSTACASDTNSGTSATCTGGCAGSVCTSGIGPLVTYQELAIHRWGTYSPRLTQSTYTITFLSSQSGNGDPVVFNPLIGNGALVQIQGPALASLTPVVSTTVSAHTAKAHPTQLLSDTLTAGSGSVSPGMFVSNTTQGLIQWVHSGTGPFLMTQALAPATFPSTGGKPAEVDTTTNGDAIRFYSFPFANLAEIVPTVLDYNGSFDNGVQVYHLNILDPSGAGDDHVLLGPQTWLIEVASQRLVQYQTLPYDNTNLITNCWLEGGFQGGSVIGSIVTTGQLNPRPSPHFQGGQVGTGLSLFADFQNTDLDGDIILSNTDGANVYGGSLLGHVFVDTGVILSTLTGPVAANQSTAYGAPVVWGPGIVNAGGVSRISLPRGSGRGRSRLRQHGRFAAQWPDERLHRAARSRDHRRLQHNVRDRREPRHGQWRDYGMRRRSRWRLLLQLQLLIASFAAIPLSSGRSFKTSPRKKLAAEVRLRRVFI